MPDPLAVPELVRERAVANAAAGGERWLRDLPEAVATLAARWDLTIGSVLDGGTCGYVVAAVDANDGQCVLKVAMPLDSDEPDAFGRSVLVHRLADGRGCARLLAADETSRAMLLERLGPNLDQLGLPVTDLLDAIATTLRSFWRPVPAAAALPTGADKASWLATFIPSTWDELGRPCPRGVIDRAVAYCDERAAAFDEAAAVLVHGDAHGWNTLDAGDGTYKLVDPEGLRSEPAHDLCAAMREYNEPLLDGDTPALVRQRAQRLAETCELDPEAVWQWGFVERVSTGLANVRDFTGDGWRAFLEVAARCL